MNRVTLPVDHLPELWPDDLRGQKVGAVLHAASVTADLRPTLSVLEEMDATGQLSLAALFGPQHGFETTTQDNMIEWTGYRHPRLGIPIHSLYGEHREPTEEMLDGLEVLFVDLMDIGARYYTFIWTMLLCMKAADRAGISVVVADRPNPINGVTREGKPQQEDYLSFVGLHPIPIRHAMTIGEIAEMLKRERFPHIDLRILPLSGWERGQFYDDTGLPWVLPSPNMPSLETAIVYPGMCLFEGTNVSEGRGTTRPFEVFGAPWIQSYSLTNGLNEMSLPGVTFREASFEPGFQKFANEICRGSWIHVTDRDHYEPVRTALAILQLLRTSYPNQFRWKEPPYEYEYEKLPIEILCGRPENEIFTHTL